MLNRFSSRNEENKMSVSPEHARRRSTTPDDARRHSTTPDDAQAFVHLQLTSNQSSDDVTDHMTECENRKQPPTPTPPHRRSGFWTQPNNQLQKSGGPAAAAAPEGPRSATAVQLQQLSLNASQTPPHAPPD